MALPSVVNTLTGFFEAGTNDTSVATRVDDYPLVVQLVGHHPFFGQGGGSYIARDAYTILDNEYLKTSVELGLVGLVALVLFLASPVVTSFAARRRSDDLELRTLCGALAGAGAAGLVCSATFDSFSFPMFVGTEALVVGLSACVWRLTREQQTTSMGAP
jgi:O-antigen ligase